MIPWPLSLVTKPSRTANYRLIPRSPIGMAVTAPQAIGTIKWVRECSPLIVCSSTQGKLRLCWSHPGRYYQWHWREQCLLENPRCRSIVYLRTHEADTWSGWGLENTDAASRRNRTHCSGWRVLLFVSQCKSFAISVYDFRINECRNLKGWLHHSVAAKATVPPSIWAPTSLSREVL